MYKSMSGLHVFPLAGGFLVCVWSFFGFAPMVFGFSQNFFIFCFREQVFSFFPKIWLEKQLFPHVSQLL